MSNTLSIVKCSTEPDLVGMASTLSTCSDSGEESGADFTATPSDSDSGISSVGLSESSGLDLIFLGSERPLVPCNDQPVKIIRDHLDAVRRDDQLDDAFYVADIGEVIRQFDRWSETLPTVYPHYAVKCNPDPLILRALAVMGAGFDCASKAEIAAVLGLRLNVDAPTRIVYANPCKAVSHLRYAASVGVRMMTFDNHDELYKIKRHHDADPQLILRILTDDSHSVCRFGTKFGASLSQVPSLLALAKQLDLPVIGISFHVGSGCGDARAYSDAISAARQAFDIASSMGIEMSLLDIGGGFPGSEVSAKTGVPFDEIAEVIRSSLAELFPVSSGVKVISEPGRFFVSAAYTLAANVFARRIVPNPAGDDNQRTYMYYVNEGVYSSLNCIYFDHTIVHPKVLLKDGRFCHGAADDPEQKKYGCIIWGPTCDAMDLVKSDAVLPELDIDDWIYFDWMGAYTVAAASTFNGFAKCVVKWTNTEPDRLMI